MPLASPRRTHSAPMPSGPSSHFWPGIAYASAPRSSSVDRDRAGGLRAVDDRPARRARGRASAMARDGQDRAGRPQHVADDDGPGPLVEGRGRTPRRSARRSPPSPTSSEVEVDPEPVAQRRAAARAPPGCSWRVVTARSPAASRSPWTAEVHAVGRGVGERDVVEVGGRARRRRPRAPRPCAAATSSEVRRRCRARRPARGRPARPSPRRSRRAAARRARC